MGDTRFPNMSFAWS